jgi:hypothetical protein
MERLLAADRPAGAGRKRIALIAAALTAHARAGRSAPPPTPPAGPGAWRQALRGGWRSR